MLDRIEYSGLVALKSLVSIPSLKNSVYSSFDKIKFEEEKGLQDYEEYVELTERAPTFRLMIIEAMLDKAINLEIDE